MTIVIVTVAAVVTKWSISLDSLYFFLFLFKTQEEKKERIQIDRWPFTNILLFSFGSLALFFLFLVDGLMFGKRKKEKKIYRSIWVNIVEKKSFPTTLYVLNWILETEQKKSKGCRSFWMMWKNRPFFLFVSLGFFFATSLETIFFWFGCSVANRFNSVFCKCFFFRRCCFWIIKLNTSLKTDDRNGACFWHAKIHTSRIFRSRRAEREKQASKTKAFHQKIKLNQAERKNKIIQLNIIHTDMIWTLFMLTKHRFLVLLSFLLLNLKKNGRVLEFFEKVFSGMFSKISSLCDVMTA